MITSGAPPPAPAYPGRMPDDGAEQASGPAGDDRAPVGVPELESVTALPGAETIDPDDGGSASDRALARIRAMARTEARRHPRRVAALLTLVTVTGLAGATLSAQSWLDGPPLPAGLVLALEPAPADGPLWQTGEQARPAGPPVLPAELDLRLPAAGRSALTVTGFSGPGVARLEGPATVPVRGSTAPTAPTAPAAPTATLRPVLDCDRLPAQAPPGAYRVALQVTDGAREATRSVPLPATSGWLESAQQACRSWRARRDLTVTTLTARVDPTSSRLTVTATIANSGRHPAVVGPTPGACCLAVVESGGALQVPAGGSATASWGIALDTCDAVDGTPGGEAPVAVDPVLSDELGLAALAGPGLPVDLTGFQPPSGPFVEQLTPLGVVLGPAAGAALTDALHRACGGLSQAVMLVVPGSTRVDLAGGRLEFDVVVDVSPGRVRSARIAGATQGPLTDAYQPERRAWGPFTPDRTGQFRARISYRIIDHDLRCLPYSGALPPLHLTVEVPEPGGTVRTVHYDPPLALEQDRAAIRLFCASR